MHPSIRPPGQSKVEIRYLKLHYINRIAKEGLMFTDYLSAAQRSARRNLEISRAIPSLLRIPEHVT